MERYRYESFPRAPGAESIRLVTIHPGIGPDHIVVSLQPALFIPTGPPEYEALSYVWGSTESLQTIYVGTRDRAALRVTRNLYVALQHLRYQDRQRVMWIDALCIDQSNDIEKGPQVALMGQVFECASRVVVWLGPEQKRSSIAMERLSHIGSQIDVDWGGIHRISPAASSQNADYSWSIADPNSELPLNRDQAIAVRDLLDREWFDRLWIRQEILVAEDKAVVCCGSFPPTDWSVFRKAIRLFYSKQPKPGNAVFFLRDRLITIGGFIFQMRHTDITGLRTVFGNALCSDPRDRIYGIRALLQDQRSLCPTPDYTKSTVDVYLDLVRNYIEKHENGLTILRQCELPEHFSDWSGPSWVPDWSTKTSALWAHHTVASSQLRQWYAFSKPGVLQVLGVSKVVVQDTRPIPKLHGHDWDVGSDFLISLVPSSMRSATYPSGGTLVQALSKTILGGATSDFVYLKGGNYPSNHIAEAVLEDVLSGVCVKNEYSKIGSDGQRFFKRMDTGSGGKTFIWGSNGYIGVGPPSTKVGDEIFVVVGCQKPLLLRRQLSGENQYSVVGECYVEGCARAEPLLGNLPDYMGFDFDLDHNWCFRDLRSGQLYYEDPRLEGLMVDLGDFRAQLSVDRQATLTVAPDVLLKRIPGLRFLDIV